MKVTPKDVYKRQNTMSDVNGEYMAADYTTRKVANNETHYTLSLIHIWRGHKIDKIPLLAPIGAYLPYFYHFLNRLYIVKEIDVYKRQVYPHGLAVVCAVHPLQPYKSFAVFAP